MPIGGRVQCIDFCIHHIVAALNAGGVRTTASCCGHRKMKGNIILEDGRVLIIQKKPETMDKWKEAVAITEPQKTENGGCESNKIKDLKNGVFLYCSGLTYMLRFGVKSGDRSERGFQRGLLKNYPGWAEGFHPSFGSA